MKRALAAVALLGTSVAHADVPVLAPNLYEHGNLRVAVACADHGLMLPEDGLHVSVDGTPLAPVHTNASQGVEVDSDGENELFSVVTDAGFLAPPGRHRVRIDAPDCTADERELDLSATYAERVDGRLPVEDDVLRGPAVAPDGYGITIGASAMAPPAELAATTAPISVPSFWVSSSFERRSWVFAGDSTAGWSSLDETSPVRATGSVFATTAALRVGRRLARDRYALAAGTGIGAGVWSASLQPAAGAVPATRPDAGLVFDWDVPVWSSLTIKASCTWGVQGLASYDVRPTDVSTSSLALALGLQWQPSQACSEEPGLAVSP